MAKVKKVSDTKYKGITLFERNCENLPEFCSLPTIKKLTLILPTFKPSYVHQSRKQPIPSSKVDGSGDGCDDAMM